MNVCVADQRTTSTPRLALYLEIDTFALLLSSVLSVAYLAYGWSCDTPLFVRNKQSNNHAGVEKIHSANCTLVYNVLSPTFFQRTN